MLKKSASGRRRAKAAMATARVPCLRRSEAPASRRQVGPLSCSRTAVYAPLATTVTPCGTHSYATCGLAGPGSAQEASHRRAAFLNIPHLLLGFEMRFSYPELAVLAGVDVAGVESRRACMRRNFSSRWVSRVVAENPSN